MLVKVNSAANRGLETLGIDVEVNVAARGLPGFDIVGLPGKDVQESRERVKTAITSSKIDFPNKKITVNLAPADLPKEGSFYDLPIAVGILAGELGFEVPKNSIFFGELSLDGSLRHTKSALLISLFAKEAGFERIYLPKDSANEAAIIKGIKILPVENLIQLALHLSGKKKILPALKIPDVNAGTSGVNGAGGGAEWDMAEILGQEQAKRAMEIAAAGGHNILMVGSPGAGKTMLARSLPGILPVLGEKEALEVTKIYSASGGIPAGGSLINTPPFRSPHHTTSLAGLIGGGSRPMPGEISLAHRGVLFLDEFNEFSRSILEAMRQPLEDGYLTIARSKERVRYPARFMLLASANPCPCGYLNHPKKSCVCSLQAIKKYKRRVSGPILDRIDLHVDVPPVDLKELRENQGASNFLESSKTVRQRVIEARSLQQKRFFQDNIFTNAEMRNNHIKKYCQLEKSAEQILQQASQKFQLSARSYLKMIKLARTIADLEGAENIETAHIAEALQYRPKEYETV